MCLGAPVQSLANHFGMINAAVPPLLNVVDLAHKLLGPSPLEYISRGLNKASGNMVPTWTPYMPQAHPPPPPLPPPALV